MERKVPEPSPNGGLEMYYGISKIMLAQLHTRDGDISWTVTSCGHYFSKWATFRGHSQRVTSRGHYFSKWVTFRGHLSSNKLTRTQPTPNPTQPKPNLT